MQTHVTAKQDTMERNAQILDVLEGHQQTLVYAVVMAHVQI